MKNNLSLLLLSLGLVISSCAGFPSSGSDRIYPFDKGLQLLTRDIIRSLEDENLYRVAVNDFQRIDEKDTVLGKAVAEELTTAFFSSDVSFSMVERNQLQSALKELELGMSSLFNEEEAARIGQMLGADALVIGSITPFQEYIKINARIFSVEDGRVIAAASVKIASSAEVEAMLNNTLGSDTGAPSAGSAASSPSRSPAPKLVQKIDDFQVELTALRREGNKLWADFLVTYRGNKSEDWIGFYNARIVDRAGKEYDPTHGGTMKLTDGWGGLTCVANVPMIGSVPFEIGMTELEGVALLEIEFRSRGKLYFRDIAIQQ